MLPSDVRVYAFFEVPFNSNSQYDATSRTYTYYMHSSEDPFISDVSAYYDFTNFDKLLLEAAINYIPEIEDFHSVCLKPNQYKTTLCKVSKATISYPSEDRITIQVSSNRFLQGMMRLLIGRVIEVAEKKVSLTDYQTTLQSKGSFRFNDKAYPQGLHLTEVRYPYVKHNSNDSFLL